MQTNTLSNGAISDDEVKAIVSSYVHYLQNSPYGAVEAEINGAACVVIAAVESEEMEHVQPMFIIPTPELILHVVDPEDKKPLFAITIPNLN